MGRMDPIPPQSPEEAAPVLAWRGPFRNDEVNALHAECFRTPVGGHDWWDQLSRHSLGWVCLRLSGRLAGFVNVAWDGSTHAFLLDTMVAPAVQRRGFAAMIVAEAARRAKAAKCDWLHVDFEPHLRAFYLDACGFQPTEAGLIALR
jgi:GNAT superfamily N-acetyltransferase